MRGRSLAPVLALVIVSIVVHATALSGFWLYDDPSLLIEAIRQPAWAVLLSPAEYTHLSATTFTPLLILSFKFDLLLQGLRPAIFYAHQILAITIAGVLLFFLLRRYVSDLYAVVGASVFLTTWAAVYATRTLMIRHYVEGLVFALAALLVWGRRTTNRLGRKDVGMSGGPPHTTSQHPNIPTERAGGTILAAFFYLLAMLSKEVYATLPVFFICQSIYDGRVAGGGWRVGRVARDLIAPATAAIVFLVWRWYMTGLTGTYAAIAVKPHFETLPAALWNHLTGPAPLWAQIVWALCIAVSIALFLWRYRLRALGFLAVSLFAMLLPLLTLTANFEWRYSFAFTAFTVAILTIALGLSEKRWAIFVLEALLLTTLVTSFDERRYYENLTRHGIVQEGRYVWLQPKSAPAIAAQSPGWYLGGLSWLRRWENRGESPPAVFSSYAITVGMIDPARIVTVSDGKIVPIAKTTLFGTPADWQRARMQYNPNAPLSIEFALRNHNAQWRLGPPASRFVFLTDPGYTAIPIPATGAQRVPAAREKQFFRIIREEADGSWSVSPTLPVPAEGAVTIWRRPLRLKVLMDRHADDVLESLGVRLDRTRRLVEKDALHPKQRHEHGDQIEVRLLTARELPEPVLK
jgi:hypothetical protein